MSSNRYAHTPARKDVTVAEAAEFHRQGWNLPISGDDTTIEHGHWRKDD